MAYLDFFGFCKQAFPGIPDQAIAPMVQGIEVDLFRPDDELKQLAKLAVQRAWTTPEARGRSRRPLAAVAARPNGPAWVGAWEPAKHPWFNFTSGTGFYSTDKVLAGAPGDPLRLPARLHRARRGWPGDRPADGQVAAERDRITGEYADAARRRGPRGLPRQARPGPQVFPYVENHNFYIEHWSHRRVLAQDARAGRVLVQAGFWPTRTTCSTCAARS